MTTSELQKNLYAFIKPIYPNIQINVEDKEDNVRELYFIEEKFQDLLPKQRYHYLIHAIPVTFYNEHLQNTQWFELAPGEKIDDLDYHDDETINEITEPILSILRRENGFLFLLDKEFALPDTKCFGDFRHAKKNLTTLGFSTDDQFDIFHVLMNAGGYCDCEILYNVFRESEYAQKYWRNRVP